MASRWRTACALILLALWSDASGAVHATPPRADAEALLQAAVDADELDLAALRARIGDEPVLAALAPETEVALQLVAVRAAPYLANPELALPALAVIAQGRDPDLAPAAARRAFQIAQMLELEDVAAREIALGPLRDTEQNLSRLSTSNVARVDVKMYAAEAAHLLRRLREPN